MHTARTTHTTFLPLRIVIADDHGIVRAGIASLLRQASGMDIVGLADNGVEAVAMWKLLRPDIVLMDLRMPIMDGVEAIGKIRDCNANAAVILLTTFDGEEDIYRGMHAGARGYLLKAAAPEELIHCIQAVGNGRTYLPAGMAEKLARRLVGDALSDREKEILKHVALGQANKVIAYHLDIAAGTVKSHIASILSKLSVTSRTAAVRVGRSRGLLEA